MEFGHYTTRAAAMAAELVNNLTADGLAALPVDLPPPGELSPDAPARLAELARRLRSVFAAGDEAGTTAAINDLLEDLPLQPHLSRHDGKAAHLHFAPDDVDAVTRVGCNTAMALATIAGEHGHQRLCVCALPECGTAFVDTSRNGRRRFCSSACANRAHVREHRRRAAGAAPSTGNGR